MSRHTFMAVYEDRSASGQMFRVKTYVQARDADAARAMLSAVKVLKFKEVKS